FDNTSAQQNLIDNLLTLVQNRNANGVNIDFEGVPSSEKNNLTDFLINLSEQFHSQIPNSQVSVALPAVDWADVFDITALKDYIDLFLIMGYDYYWTSGGVGDIAGPTGQLYTMYDFNYNQSRSVIYYLNEGVPHEKLCLGVPYYGFDWQTNDDNVPTEAVANGSPIFISTIKENAEGYYSNKNIEDSSLCAYYNYNNGNFHQAWIDDEETMQFKYDLVLRQGIAGIGIWALGYDDGYSEMWDLIKNNFSSCAEVPTTYDFFDMGGPLREHYNREDYIYTIAPTNYVSDLTLSFSSFELEAGYDSLWIYDGANIEAPLIGGYSGNTSPNIIEASGGALTIKFHSDGATVKQGWNAKWNCNSSSVATNNSEIEIYPNPANQFIKIQSDLIPVSVKIYSLQGKLVATKYNSKYINTSNLKSGFYFIEVNFLNQKIVNKIIINH
ncbi:MAG: T9SS type A sorting domain-containing protein, partial [Chlorobi bacterium]|nr:T9SS type A sorting domain-containing protein [Chlorobiota bacterium]